MVHVWLDKVSTTISCSSESKFYFCMWRSIRKFPSVWQKKERVCNSVKRKYGQIFCQDWVSVKTYLMIFCHNSKIFCQTLVVTLTVCCSVKVYSHVWQNSLGVWQNLINVLVLFDRTTQKCLKNRKMSLSPIQIKILKNPRDKIW